MYMYQRGGRTSFWTSVVRQVMDSSIIAIPMSANIANETCSGGLEFAVEGLELRVQG